MRDEGTRDEGTIAWCVRRGLLILGGILVIAALPSRAVAAATWVKTQEIALPENTFAGRHRLAMDGSTLIVATTAGAVVYVADSSGTWTQQAQLNAPSAAPAVAISGDTALVSGTNDSSQGFVTVFVRSGTTWSSQATLFAPDGTANDGFGTTVNLSGDSALVQSAAKTYFFGRSGTVWAQQTEIAVGGGAISAQAISGDTAVVGDPSGGRAYVYVKSGAFNWTLQQTLVPSTGDPAFGGSAVLAGDTLYVGSYDVSQPSGPVGSIYIETRSGSTWSETKVVHPSAVAAKFALALALGNGVLVADNAFGPVVFTSQITDLAQKQILTDASGPAGARQICASGLTIIVPESQTLALAVYNPSSMPAPVTAPTIDHPPAPTTGHARLTNFFPPSPVLWADGFSLTGMSYTYTADTLDKVTLVWSAQQDFQVGFESKYSTFMSWETTVAISGAGSATYQLDSGFYDLPGPPVPATPTTLTGTTKVSYTASPTNYVLLGSGLNVLVMNGLLVFTPSVVGETISVSSTYTAVPVQAPSSPSVPALPGRGSWVLALLLGGAGCVLLGTWRRRYP
ncbi:MAG TPA: FG-GAP repeat protein [Polyangia bacterium]|nr:FG-GAP repeat protein [Polyangia bacterium]